MVTNDERKRVANELRQYVKKFGTPTWRVLCNIVLGADSRHQSVRMLNLLDRLAELIEPSEDVRCIATVKVEGEKLEELAKGIAAEYARVDREALADIAHEMDLLALTCDHYGHQVSPMAVANYARIIREAIREVPYGDE